jgi:predicted nucleic acid-binding protein
LRIVFDTNVLFAAFVARADAVVTGDKDLLALGRIERILILSPATASPSCGAIDPLKRIKK